MIELLDGNSACAWAVKLCKVQVIPVFPITPQTELMEILSEWKAEGKIDLELLFAESEHSVLSAALGSEMTENRTFTSTSSQGLMLMHEILPIVSGTRMPVVMVNGCRAIAAPITLWPDHNDFLAMRDSGWLLFMAETNQELLDSIIIAFKVSEDKRILLPSLVGMDGFILSYTREEVNIPEQELVDKFLPELKLEVKIDLCKPMTLGTPCIEEYMYFKSQLHKAQLNALKALEEAHKEWFKLTGRNYDLIEEFYSKDARAVIVMMGANSTIAKAAVRQMRKKGKKAGLLRIRILRPFPEEKIKNALKKAKRIAVVDQNISAGISGILYPEIKACIADGKKTVSNYIISLGGKMVSVKDFKAIFNELLKARKEERKWLM
ncbi:MAG: transketolase C-terminal domain-containing protein [Candidatus Diapherotrites archaeon]